MNEKTEVLVIGGGCMGLGIARALALAGKQVSLLEAGKIGREASWASAGMIGPQSEAMEPDAYFAASLVSRDLWPEYAAGLSKDSGMDLGYHTQGAVHLAFGAAYETRLEAKYLWQKEKAGRVEKLDRAALLERFPYLAPRVSAGYMAYGDQWIDNEKLMEALTVACQKAGVRLQEHTPVEELKLSSGKLAGLRAGGRDWEAEQVIIAAGAWSSKILGDLLGGQPRIYPIKGQMVSFFVEEDLLPPVPIHAENVYLVPRADNRLLVGATVETVGFDKNLTGEGVEYVLQGAFETIPDLRRCAIERLWAGLRPGSSDGWPSLGATSLEGLYLACGHFRRGILFLPLTVQALCDAVLNGRLPEAAEAFSFQRHLARKAATV